MCMAKHPYKNKCFHLLVLVGRRECCTNFGDEAILYKLLLGSSKKIKKPFCKLKNFRAS